MSEFGAVEGDSRADRMSDRAPSGREAGNDSDLEPVDDLLAGLVERHAGPTGLAGARVLDDWAALAGEWEGRAQPVSIKDGLLVLEVISGADATLLRYDEGAIRARIQAKHGAGIVRAIRVRVARDGGRR